MPQDLSLPAPLKESTGDDAPRSTDGYGGDANGDEGIAEDLFPLFSQPPRDGEDVTGVACAGGWQEGAAPPSPRSLRDAHHVQQLPYAVASAGGRRRGGAPLPSPEQRPPHEMPWWQWWPHPPPPPLASAPPPGQSRVSYHSERYAAFIRDYVGLSDEEVKKAKRRGRSICMIGVRKLQKPKIGTVVQAQRYFLRHSVLAVEGDAVFAELMCRAEALYAQGIQHLWEASDSEVRTALGSVNCPSSSFRVPTLFRSMSAPPCARGNNKKVSRKRATNSDRGGNLVNSSLSSHSSSPNARCIALHYGLPAHSPCEETGNMGVSHDCSADSATSNNSRQAPYYRRATLIAVVSTTHIASGEEVRVSLESYHRCLDESAWYGRRYTSSHPPRSTGKADDIATLNPLSGELHNGVKEFKLWPKSLAYYHGVGRRHADDSPRAGFPFTLVDLAPAPELGEGELGVAAAAFLPYATCLLYTGPAVATKKVEKIAYETKPGLLKVLEGRSPTALLNEQGRADFAVDKGKEEPSTSNRVSLQDVSVNQRAILTTKAAEEDLSFATDDTYALGLGRHGVCFGQGIARYINHRYNLSRFGNVELCSVMLSVLSGFSTPSDGKRDKSRTNPKSGSRAKSHKLSATAKSAAIRKVKIWSGTTPPPPTPSDVDIAKHLSSTFYQSKASVESYASNGSAVASLRGGASASSVRDSKPPRRRQRTKMRSVFLEEHSHFVTLPFFITTADIEAGTPLLAWTYGEEYDAKLERVAVADGALVPYADAALLNARPIMGTVGAVKNSEQRGWQRYGGDYRYALGIGDVVWRRRPSPLWGPASYGPQMRCPPPEDDLFVVVDVMSRNTDRVLLMPLRRRYLTDVLLHELLAHQKLDRYVSPAVHTTEKDKAEVKKEAVKADVTIKKENDAEDDEVKVILGAKLYAFRSRSSSRAPMPRLRSSRSVSTSETDHPTAPLASPYPIASTQEKAVCSPPPLQEAWAIFDVDMPGSSGSCHSLRACAHNELYHCFIDSVGSVSLLLSGIDYCVVRPAADVSSSAPSTPLAAEISRNSILVNLHDLHDTTRLVRESVRSCMVPALWNGLLWPLIRDQPRTDHNFTCRLR
ncbi:unnamed protein product [Phytomonas sp. EM1]|nr:unnamed protein product [Phytomonas sp. EM1]|eukprot:CCW64810.1 unnamed protein product [Phytomonas sp. isolate EM1]